MNEPVKPELEPGAADGLAAAQSQPGPPHTLQTPVSQGLVQGSVSGSDLGSSNNARPMTAGDYLPKLESQYCAEDAGEKIIPSAFEFFNRHMGGWRSGLHILAGEPGSGKTAFALCNAAAAARQGFPVLFLSFDVQPELLVTKLLCQQARLNSREMMDGALDADVVKVAMAAQAETFARITLIEADPELPNEQAEDIARQLIAESERDRILVVVDYLQIWAAGNRQFSEFRHEIAKLMTAMRRLALSLDSPVLAVSSQNRQHQGEAVLQSLEGTSDLEYSADSVSFLINVERPASQGSYTHPDDLISKSRTVSINLRKNRFGETASRMVKFLPSTGAFDEETVRRPLV